MTTTLVKAWHQPAPTRNGLVQRGLPDAELWASRLLLGRERAARHQSAELAAITRVVASIHDRPDAIALSTSLATARSLTG